MKPEITIILPVYNADVYLHRCIESILGQYFANFELIIVNDGSTDHSGEICDQYALKDNRVKVVHVTKCGVSNARNTGIKMARGKYLMFCDSDDYVEKDWCRHLYDAAVENKNSLPVSGICIFNNIGEIKKVEVRVSDHMELFNKNKYFQTYRTGLFGSICNRIYDKEIIIQNSICFDINMKKRGDTLFNLSYMNHMDSFITVPFVDYNYIHSNVSSITNQYRANSFIYDRKAYNSWQVYFSIHKADKKDVEDCSTHYFYTFLDVMKNTLDQRNPDNLIKKLKYNNNIVNSKEFVKCLELADLSKEDDRYIRLLKTKNYYLVWLAEQVFKVKNKLLKK